VQEPEAKSVKEAVRIMMNLFEIHTEQLRMEGRLDGLGYQRQMDMIREMREEMQW